MIRTNYSINVFHQFIIYDLFSDDVFHLSRQKPSTNTSTLSVANPNGGPGSMIGDHVSNTNVVIEENNSTGSGADE